MNHLDASFFFAHTVEIRVLLAVSAIFASAALIKLASFIGDVAGALRTGAALQLETNDPVCADAR